jgi:hypothetical protein
VPDTMLHDRGPLCACFVAAMVELAEQG